MSVGSVVKGIGAQVNPFDGGKTYGTYNNGLSAKPKTAAVSTPAVTGGASGYDASGAIAALQGQIDAGNKALAASQAQTAALPRLPVYNTAAAYASAQKTATAAVDPVYQDKLNQYLQGAALDRTQQTRLNAEKVAGIQTGLDNTLEDNALSGTRTAEDQATKLGDTAQSETNYQTDSGTSFDRARTALLGNVANSGLTTSGIGQNQVAQATGDRNQAEKEQTQTFDNTRRDINTTASRTFDDLATSSNRAKSSASTNTAQSKQALQDYIDNAGLAEQSFRTSNEEARQGAISDASQAQYKTGVQQFIASLVGSGARAQDIALAAQVYG